jgi:zinc transport system permease protein
MIQDILSMALAAGVLAALASGVVGSFVVAKRIAFLAGSISHSILGGMGFCLWLQRSYGIVWLDPMIGAFGAALISAWLIGWIHLRFRQREDALIAAVWSTGTAIGVIFISLTPGTNVDLINFLFGNILWVGHSDLLWLGCLDLAILVLVGWFYRPFLALCYDEEQATLQGVPVRRYYLLLLSLLALSIVVLVQVIGTLLVITLLTLPAMLASLFTQRFLRLIGLSILFSALFSLLGLELSYRMDWPPGATIALTAAVCYLFGLTSSRVNR